MTTDPTPLQERIARAIRLADTGDSLPDGFAERMWDDGVTNRDKEMRLAAAVLPFIAAEVRKAQGEAWTDCVSEASALGWLHAPAALDMLDRNPHGTGDRA